MRLIDADKLEVVRAVIPSDVDTESYIMGIEYILNKIDNMPTIEERKTGMWTPMFNGVFKGGTYWFECSQCKRIAPEVRNGGWNFCPNCGAKMEGNNETD